MFLGVSWGRRSRGLLGLDSGGIGLNDRWLTKIVKRCQDLPGYELFQYLDAEGEHHTVDSADVSDYLREISHENFTAKDFRTRAGTVLTCTALQELGVFESESQPKKNVLRAIKAVAACLGNTPSVCRKCYIHPAVPECYLNGELLQIAKRQLRRDGLSKMLENEEEVMLRLLHKGRSA